MHRKALRMSRFPCTLPHQRPPHCEIFIIGSRFFENFKLIFKEIHCRCCGSLLTKSDNKPTYQSPENRTTHNLTFSTLGTNLYDFKKEMLCLMTLNPWDNPVKFRPCAQNCLRDIKV